MNAPQAGSDAAAVGAEGATCVALGAFEGAAAKVASPDVSNRDQAISNRVQNIDVTSVANDKADDGDYDDPYPGGPTAGGQPATYG